MRAKFHKKKKLTFRIKFGKNGYFIYKARLMNTTIELSEFKLF